LGGGLALEATLAHVNIGICKAKIGKLGDPQALLGVVTIGAKDKATLATTFVCLYALLLAEQDNELLAISC
jgi:hypothetical protein